MKNVKLNHITMTIKRIEEDNHWIFLYLYSFKILDLVIETIVRVFSDNSLYISKENIEYLKHS